MKRIVHSLRVLALSVVLLAMSVVPASGIDTEGTRTSATDTAKFCDYPLARAVEPARPMDTAAVLFG